MTGENEGGYNDSNGVIKGVKTGTNVILKFP